MEKQFDIYVPNWKIHQRLKGSLILKGLYFSSIYGYVSAYKPEPRIINLKNNGNNNNKS